MPPKPGRPMADRSKQIDLHFGAAVIKEGRLYFPCLVPGCGKEILCELGRGARGRATHLEKAHEEIQLPPPAERKPSAKAAAPAAADDGDDEERVGRERPREVVVAQAAVIDFVARQLLPFTVAGDELFAGLGLNRDNIAEKLAERAVELRDRTFAAVENERASVSIDSGTNAGARTLNVVANFRGMSRTIGAARIAEQTAQNVADAVAQIVAPLAAKLRIVAFASDNASNMRNALDLLATRHRCQLAHCGCHAINIFVTKIAYEWVAVDNGRQAANKARASGANIPAEIATRWNPAFLAIKATMELRAELVYRRVLTHQEADAALEAHRILQPLYVGTLQLEKDTATIFDAVEVFGSRFHGEIANDDLFAERFTRNCASEALVAAAALSPALSPGSLIRPVRMMVETNLRACLARINPEFNERAFDQQFAVWAGGAKHRAWIASDRANGPEEVWNSGDTPMLAELLHQLARTPASSANVERSFSPHARLHTTARASLLENSVTAQLVLNSFLRPLGVDEHPRTHTPSSLSAVRVLIWCLPSWLALRLDRLAPRVSVLTWFVVDGQERQYRCTLLEDLSQQHGGQPTWRVTWNGDRENRQLFKPLIDPWVLLEEAGQ